MIDLKPYGAFIQNTVRPLVEEAKSLLNDLDRHGLPMNRDNIKFILDYLSAQYKDQLSMQFITTIIVSIIICITIFAILK